MCVCVCCVSAQGATLLQIPLERVPLEELIRRIWRLIAPLEHAQLITS